MYPELLRYYERRLPNPAFAEDTVSELFERVLKIENVRTPQAVVRTIAHSLLVDAYREEDRHPAPLSWEELIGPRGDKLDRLPQFQSPPLEDSTFAADFDRAVRVLDSPPRDAFILGELRGLPSREVAPLLDVSHVTAVSRRELATQLIREELAHA